MANVVVKNWKTDNIFNIVVRLVNPSPLPVTVRYSRINVVQFTQLDKTSVVSTVNVQSNNVDDLPLNVSSHNIIE